MGREKITSKSIEMVNLGQQKQKDDNYTEFINFINNKSLRTKKNYSLAKTIKWKLCDFFKSRSFEQRAEKSLERVVKNKKFTCWDLALGMHSYITNTYRVENWICGYSLSPGICHAFNLAEWPLQFEFADNSSKIVVTGLAQIDPLCFGFKPFNIPDPTLDHVRRFHPNASKLDQWYVMDNDLDRNLSHKWAKFHDFATKVVLRDGKYEYYAKKIRVEYKYRGWTFF